MRTAQDFISLTAKIQMDLGAAQAKMTELRAWIAALPLPEESIEFSEAAALALVRNCAYWYPDESLRDELHRRGAAPDVIDKVMAEAGAVREAGPPRKVEA